jgi:hypothetical protein
MPIRYVIDKERRLVLTTAEDILTFAEVKLHQDRLRSDPDLDPTFNQLIDGTTVRARKALQLNHATLRRQSLTIVMQFLYSQIPHRAALPPGWAVARRGMPNS